MNTEHHTSMEVIMQHLTAPDPADLREALAVAFNGVMRTQREHYLGARRYQRTAGRRRPAGGRQPCYANVYQPKRLLTQFGELDLRVPKTRNHGDAFPFHPYALERGQRCTRALAAAVCEMYFNGVSTRRVRRLVQRFGVEHLSKDQVSRYVAVLDPAFERWRNRALGECRYLVLDAHYDKARVDGAVESNAALTAVGVAPSGHRRILGLAVGRSEAETLWREFLKSLVARGLHGVELVTADHHLGLERAVQAVFPAADQQRCQFHLSRNAAHHAPTRKIADRIRGELRPVWKAGDRAAAERALAELVARYRPVAPRLADWLEQSVPEGLTVFRLPPTHRCRMRTTNLLERLHREVRRRTRQVGVFPNPAAIERLVTGIYIESDEEWETNSIPYLKFSTLEEPKCAA